MNISILFSHTCANFQYQENDNTEPVKHVMDSGAGEGPTKVVFVGDLSYRDNGIRDRGPDVSAHYNGDGQLYIDN